MRRRNPGWWSYVHDYVSPRERELTAQEAHVRDVAYGIKNGDPDAVEEAAQALVRFVPDGAVVVPTPASKADEFGGVSALADRLAQLVGGIYAKLVYRTTSVPSSHQSRKSGVKTPDAALHEATMTVRGAVPRQVVLVDNVVVTGSTLGAARSLLRQAGATDVIAVVWAEAKL